jgi:hypothetical protein
MRVVVGVVYWSLVGFLAVNTLYVSVGENRLWWSGALVPAALALLVAWWPGLGYSGAGLVVVGSYPALFLTRFVLDQGFSMDWSCSTVAFDGISNPNGGTIAGPLPRGHRALDSRSCTQERHKASREPGYPVGAGFL